MTWWWEARDFSFWVLYLRKNVVLGALSVALIDSTLQHGGFYIGSQNLFMIKNTMHSLDQRIEEMDVKYKKKSGIWLQVLLPQLSRLNQDTSLASVPVEKDT